MTKLEDLLPNATVRGVLPESAVTVVNVQWFGSDALELTYKSPTGKVANEILYRDDEPRLELVVTEGAIGCVVTSWKYVMDLPHCSFGGLLPFLAHIEPRLGVRSPV